jgi:hypothetical protein
VSRIYRRHHDVRLTALDGEGVVLHLGTRRYFTVNATALTLLNALASPRTVGDMIGELMANYAVSEERAAAGVHGFLERCAKADLVVHQDR